MEHTHTACNGQSTVPVENLLGCGPYITTPETDTSVSTFSERKLGNEGDSTLNCTVSTQLTDEVRGLASREEIPSIRTGKSKCALRAINCICCR
jgi:hypothetical protein